MAKFLSSRPGPPKSAPVGHDGSEVVAAEEIVEAEFLSNSIDLTKLKAHRLWIATEDILDQEIGERFRTNVTSAKLHYTTGSLFG